MFRKTLMLVLTGFLACSVQLSAQDETTPTPPSEKKGDSPGRNRFWQATLNGGHYMVALDRISSVSRHKYLLDGAVIVDEVTVDALGQALARFYHISPVTDAMAGNAATQLAERGRELLDKATQRAGTNMQNMVIKKYPETSHARTIEYRILSEADLSALHASVRSAWESGRGRQFSAK